MSVDPRNGLWNRLLARAEARAREESPPEPHHYCPLSAGDNHLRTSMENSLVYHGLKIETDFNLRLQRPPRKRKIKRKTDLPVAERLRNDRTAAGSPGPTHRTPTGTPGRRVSKTTPLSRPPVPPPPPVPPIPATTRAAAARERVLNAVSDDDELPMTGNGPAADLSDSSDGGIFLARTKKPSGGEVIVLPHFDQAANSNDTSSWEDHAILVGQPPPKEQEPDEDEAKTPERDARTPTDMSPGLDDDPPYKLSKPGCARHAKVREKITPTPTGMSPASDDRPPYKIPKPGRAGQAKVRDMRTPIPSDLSPVLDLGPAYKTSKHDRALRARAHRVGNGDSSPAPDSDSGKSRSGSDSVDETERHVLESGKPVDNVKIPAMEAEPMSRERKERNPSARLDEESKKNETSKQNAISENNQESKEGNRSCTWTPCPRSSSLGDSLLSRIRRLWTKEPDGRQCSPVPVLAISSSSEEDPPTPLRRRSPPMRALEPRRPSPSDVTIEDKLFGALSPLSSPRRRTRSMSESEKRFSRSEGDSSAMDAIKRTYPGRRNSQETHAASLSPRGGRKRRDIVVQEPPSRKRRRRSKRNHEKERRDCNLEVVATRPTDLNASPREQGNAQSAPSHQGPKRKTVRKSAPRDSSSDAWEDALPVVPIKVDAPPTPKKIRDDKSPPVSSLSRSSGASNKAKRKSSKTGSQKRTRSEILRIENIRTTDADRSDDQLKVVLVPRPRKGRLKRLHEIHKLKKATTLQKESSFGNAKSVEASRREKIATGSQEVQEIHDSDSDVCIVSFSPAQKRGSNTSSPRNRGQHVVSRQRKRRMVLKREKPKSIKCSLDGSSLSPVTKSRHEEAKRTVRTSPRRTLPVTISSPSELLRNRRSPRSHSSSDDSYASVMRKSREEVKRTKQARAGGSLPLRIRRPVDIRRNGKGSKSGTKGAGNAPSERAGRLQMNSDSDEPSDSTFGVYWLNNDQSTYSLAKNGEPRRRSPKRGDRERQSGPGRRGGSSGETENSDSCVDVDGPLNVNEGSKDVPRRKRRRR